ncbi:MAG: glycosyltransferase family 2 protein [Desulfobacterales bacterium]|jgi:glycosyltransferase involved in cell wall biosynthesis|nr:glycosyltransferase family 2 protein [Desulfobacterales bacterium]MDP6808171.1 glycosyltransferase family 2 protein [Desulfobacterales bacterium]|tara:strand:- start:6131 stop:7102 length:972 start_codon:yes stop_codon:yes gene_type:complete
MKLIVQIPCLNEEKTVPITIQDIPRSIDGIDQVEILVIDDGSTDRTFEVAKASGVDHIIKLNRTRGLAQAFAFGIDECLKLGADIIVNTDADNQYSGADIPKLIEPILKNEVDIVVGARDMDAIEHFSFIKKRLQKLGSWVVRVASGTDIADVTSGFRALNKTAAMRINVISEFSYTLESIIQAGNKRISLKHVPIATNERLREPRLFKGTWGYLRNSIPTIIRVYTMYQPLKIFLCIAGVSFFAGVLISFRFLYYYYQGQGEHIQSLILAAILIISSVLFISIGFLSDLIAGNRKLIEDALYRVKNLEISNTQDDPEHNSTG